MNAPDRIYVTTSEKTWMLAERRHDYDVAYIRSGSLLEWAEEATKDEGLRKRANNGDEWSAGYLAAMEDLKNELVR